VFSNSVKVTHLDISCALYWNNKVFAYGENIVFNWVPIGPHLKDQSVFLQCKLAQRKKNVHPINMRDQLVMGVV
jgi:hypothetical protein